MNTFTSEKINISLNKKDLATLQESFVLSPIVKKFFETFEINNTVEPVTFSKVEASQETSNQNILAFFNDMDKKPKELNLVLTSIFSLLKESEVMENLLKKSNIAHVFYANIHDGVYTLRVMYQDIPGVWDIAFNMISSNDFPENSIFLV